MAARDDDFDRYLATTTRILANPTRILTHRQAQTLVLHLYGRTIRQTAMDLGISKSTAHQHLHAALRIVATHLEQEQP